MHGMQLSAVDLNLLTALHALVETRSVKQAAVRLSLSPSATSHALGRLRDLFDDPLLVRSGRGLTLTPRAELLRPALARLMGDAQGLLADPGSFDAGTSERAFTIGTNDYVEHVLLVPLSRVAADRAPRVRLYSRKSEAAVEELRAGSIDLLLGAPLTAPADVLSEELYQERHVCLLRAGHPAVGEPLTVERYAALSHILVAPGGTPVGVMDRRLAALGLSRAVTRTVGTFAVAPQMLRGSDLVLTLAEQLARPLAEQLGLEVVDAPFPVPFPIAMAWHRRSEGDPAHRWLRSSVREIAGRLGAAGFSGSRPEAS